MEKMEEGFGLKEEPLNFLLPFALRDGDGKKMRRHSQYLNV